MYYFYTIQQALNFLINVIETLFEIFKLQFDIFLIVAFMMQIRFELLQIRTIDDDISRSTCFPMSIIRT